MTIIAKEIGSVIVKTCIKIDNIVYKIGDTIL